jgi:hypothetical protein
MSYNYLNQNKYNLITLEDDTQTFIFELLLKDKFNNITIIRKIKKNSYGNLLSPGDNINYSNINKYKLSIININNPDEPIIIKNNINHNLISNTYNNNNIQIEIKKMLTYFINKVIIKTFDFS